MNTTATEATSAPAKKPVSLRALLQRINRKLAHDDEKLLTYRGTRWATDLGRYYIINFNRNTIECGNQDPETLGRELGVLREFEQLVTDEPAADEPRDIPKLRPYKYGCGYFGLS